MTFLNVRTRFCCHIDLLTHREAVISEQLVTASLRYIPLANTTASRETHCVRVIREGWGSLYIIYSSCEMGGLARS